MTWQECKLVEKEVQFIVPDISCRESQKIWYYEPETREFTRMSNKFDCEVNIQQSNLNYIFVL